MSRISLDNAYLDWVCQQLAIPVHLGMQGIYCVDDDGKLLAAAVYEGYNTVSVYMHLWWDGSRPPSKDWIAACADYPFNRLNVLKVVGKVAEDNEMARSLNEHLGCTIEARIKDYSPRGDLLIYTVTRGTCRILTNPLWERALARVQEVV